MLTIHIFVHIYFTDSIETPSDSRAKVHQPQQRYAVQSKYEYPPVTSLNDVLVSYMAHLQGNGDSYDNQPSSWRASNHGSIMQEPQ